MSKASFIVSCKAHDWYFHYRDDAALFGHGKRQRDNLLLACADNGVLLDIYIHYYCLAHGLQTMNKAMIELEFSTGKFFSS